MVKIKIIRHSERLDFSYPLYWIFCFGHYWADSPLTSNGYKIADMKGKAMLDGVLNPKTIYTSPYSRTMATAMEIKKSFPEAEISIVPLLAEYQPYYKHGVNLYPEGIPTTYEGKDTEFVYPETYDQFFSRVEFIIHKLINKDSDAIIVTHGEVLKAFISYLQELYPDLILDSGDTPYLTVLSFEYDGKEIIEDTIKIE